MGVGGGIVGISGVGLGKNCICYVFALKSSM
jgi:hypothetical protein